MTDEAAIPSEPLGSDVRARESAAGGSWYPDRIALCLSGGGFRAALFHLGVVRRLNELGLLTRVDAISSVSGGSILAAHLAARLQPWPSTLPADRFDRLIADPFMDFSSRNIRTAPILKRLLPQNWLRTDTAARGLAQIYDDRLTKKLTVGAIAGARPRFVVCATDLAFGVNWIFDTDGRSVDNNTVWMGDYQVGYKNAHQFPLSDAIAASSCFPPVFNPLNVHLDPGEYERGLYDYPDRDELVRGVSLSDGGVYDNLASQPVIDHYGTIFMSDGGAPFGPIGPIRRFSFLKRVRRYTSVAQRGGGAMRKEHLIDLFKAGQRCGVLAAIGTKTKGTPPPGVLRYPGPLIHDRIENVRTDLDSFSEPEQAVLQNHGYLEMDAALRTHPRQVANVLPTPIPAPTPPFPEWLDEDRVRAALKTSSKRKVLLQRRSNRPR
jgi:NTE family protein